MIAVKATGRSARGPRRQAAAAFLGWPASRWHHLLFVFYHSRIRSLVLYCFFGLLDWLLYKGEKMIVLLADDRGASTKSCKTVAISSLNIAKEGFSYSQTQTAKRKALLQLDGTTKQQWNSLLGGWNA